ncbi:hypothetical protein [Granulicoccus phenolivorans]|uniref:hypothetical protein n=1 Tax=Granulicoccus phenolivorans TaxID=266854 RepID=UPI00041A879E|nr:hypothetical protein [Granulicoccus phenolivorans]
MPTPAPPSQDPPTDLATLRREVDLLKAHVHRIDRELAALRPLVDAVRDLRIWDHTLYDAVPGTDWVAVDRTQAERLLAALAATDHWSPWQTRIEARPTP